MNIRPTLRARWIVAACLLFSGCATRQSTVAVNANTYTIQRQAGNAFDRDLDKLRSEAQADAEKFCADRGKKLKVISIDTNKPWYTLGYATATITFKALDAGDPQLLPPPAPAGVASTEAAASAPAPVPQISGDLYTQLKKLDELRKSGILTDEEFQTEKRKILNRSQ